MFYGIDIWDGSINDVNNFKNLTGSTFPILLKGSKTAANYGLYTDDFVVVDADGIVVYVAQNYNRRGLEDILEQTTAVEEKQTAVPTSTSLAQNYPNPFNPETTISYQIHSNKPQPVQLEIFDITGKTITVLVDSYKMSGNYQVKWDGIDHRGNRVSSGLYIYQLLVGLEKLHKRMLLMK